MARLLGADITRKDMLDRVGDISQVGGIRLVELADGRERGVRAAEFRTGSGLEFTVLIDRGMDIDRCDYKGVPIAWRSATRSVHPAYFEPEGLGWLRSFFGGSLTTCGLTYAHHPTVDEGEELGLHGRISNTPARNIQVDEHWEGDDFVMQVTGETAESMHFGPHMVLRRSVTARLGERRLTISDTVENRGYRTEPLMMLYHMNFGSPLLDASAEMVAAVESVAFMDERAEHEPDDYPHFLTPQENYEERCYRLRFYPDESGFVHVGLLNSGASGGLGVHLRYRREQLPYMVEWKMLQRGVYVVGLEPANCAMAPRDKLRASGELPMLEAGDSRSFEVEVGVLEGSEELERFAGAVDRCRPR